MKTHTSKWTVSPHLSQETSKLRNRVSARQTSSIVLSSLTKPTFSEPLFNIVCSLLCLGVSSQRRKSRKAYLSAPSSIRRKLMSAHLSKELKAKWECRSLPVRHGDTVKIQRGSSKNKEGKVTEVYRRKWCIYIENVTKRKTNGQEIKVPIHPSNCEITQLKLDTDRKALLGRKKRSASDKHKMAKMDWAALSWSVPLWLEGLTSSLQIPPSESRNCKRLIRLKLEIKRESLTKVSHPLETQISQKQLSPVEEQDRDMVQRVTILFLS